MNTKIDTRLWNLMDMLRGLGFSPEEHDGTEYQEEWFIRPVRGGTQNLRISVHPDDGHRVEAHYLDRHYCAEYGVTFSPGTPFAVIRLSVKAMINA